MMDAEQRESARQFVSRWHGKGNEDEDGRSHWLDFWSIEYSGRLGPVFRESEPLFRSSLNRRFQIDRATYPMLRA